MDLCQALRNNETLTELSLANTTLNDYGAANLAAALESNAALLKINIESNNVSPQCLVKIFEVMLTYIFSQSSNLDLKWFLTTSFAE